MKVVPSACSQAYRRVERALIFLAAAVLLLGSSAACALERPMAAPAAAVVDEARSILAAMQSNPRGPYSRIRWFCADGSRQPPQAYACRERGGGRQHAEYSPERERLATLGWSVGTIFAAASFEEWWSPVTRQARLRELALERYLIDVDDGWVLRRARDYRGRVQLEDELAAGRALLLQLLAQESWTASDFLLLRELARVIPHHGGDDPTRSVRREAQELAEADASFEPLRIEVHTEPVAATAARVRAWAEKREARPDDELTRRAAHLAQELDLLYGAAGRSARLKRMRVALAKVPVLADFAQRLDGLSLQVPAAEQISILGETLRALRMEYQLAGLGGGARLALLDLLPELEALLEAASAEFLTAASLPRKTLLRAARDLADAAFGSGLLQPREREAITEALDALLGADPAAAVIYASGLKPLQLASAWAGETVRFTFAEALLRYTALEPRAATFLDDVLRGSPMRSLAEVTHWLALDAGRQTGVRHSLFGTETAGLVGLNPGVATGRLRVLDDAAMESGVALSRDEIVVLPQTVSELSPVAGVITLGEGNLLSHVQLLARNFGIPNVSAAPGLAVSLAAFDGTRVLLAVGSDGGVLAQREDELDPAVAALLGKGNKDAADSLLQVPPPDLSVRRPLPLEELNKTLSGRVVGPKAANLGELARLFPGRVAPAIALPFGVFDAHVSAGENAPRVQLNAAWARFRAGEIDAATLAAQLESIRQQITSLTVSPALQAVLAPMMEQMFGAPGSYGIFIRSDTNVEDLPGFTGAGLSETLPHLVGLDQQLAGIPRVWASVLSPRAVAWRSGLLVNPEEVHASVLLMRSVPSTKSGVLVTADLAGRTAGGVTVSTAFGIGGAVAGEAAETLVLLADGSERLLSDAKSPWARRLAPRGGIDWVPATAGAVLTPEEKAQLRWLATTAEERYRPVSGPDGQPLPWDIEFGFVEGELTLFQIRPLIERGQQRADRVLRAVLGPPKPVAGAVSLDGLVLAPGDAYPGDSNSHMPGQ